jgi:hypothetical protein
MRLPGTSGHQPLHLLGAISVVLVAAAATGGYVALTSGTTRPSSKVGPSARPLVADAGAPSTASAPTGSAGAGAIACPMIPADTGPADTGPADTGPVGQSTGVGDAIHVFTRTTADGVTIRTYDLPASGPCGCGTATAAAAGTDGAVTIELSDDTAVGIGTLFAAVNPTPTTTNAGTGPVNPVSGTFGVAEGAPVWWTALTVGPDVASARMTFADGSTDQMTPVDGDVVLAHHVDSGVASSGQGPDVVRGTLRLLDSAGAVLTTVPIPEPISPSPMPPRVVPGSPPLTIPASATHPPPSTLSPAPAPAPTPGATGADVICSDTNTPARSAQAVAAGATNAVTEKQ